MLVLDEAFDCWERAKKPYDYHLYFKDWWQRDIDAMVLRDRNHPSVAIWSIGNEIPERDQPEGAQTGKMLADYVRKLDPTRPITTAANNPQNWLAVDNLFASLDIGGEEKKTKPTAGGATCGPTTALQFHRTLL